MFKLVFSFGLVPVCIHRFALYIGPFLVVYFPLTLFQACCIPIGSIDVLVHHHCCEVQLIILLSRRQVFFFQLVAPVSLMFFQ